MQRNEGCAKEEGWKKSKDVDDANVDDWMKRGACGNADHGGPRSWRS